MENAVTSVKDAGLEEIITKLKNAWLTEKGQFDENAWQGVCDRLAQEASKGCGLSYDVFAQKFSDAIEDRLSGLSENHQSCAIEIATQYGYATPEEIRETRKFNAESGACPHGIDWGCCPAGCGS